MTAPLDIDYAGPFFADALQCLEAGELLFCGQSTDPEFLEFFQPRGMLLIHAVELALKSFCLAEGHALADLRTRKFGHNLAALLTLAEGYGLATWMNLTDEDRRALKVLNADNVSKQYSFPRRYHNFESGYCQDGFARDFARRLLEAFERRDVGRPNETVHLGHPRYRLVKLGPPEGD
jgi:hypothetical protein